jgi:hypothetical protein
MTNKIRKKISSTLFLLGLVILLSAPMNITGAVIGAPQITPGITSLIGIGLMFAGLITLTYFKNEYQHVDVEDIKNVNKKEKGKGKNLSDIVRTQRMDKGNKILRPGSEGLNTVQNKIAEYVLINTYIKENGRKPSKEELYNFIEEQHRGGRRFSFFNNGI